MGERKFQWWRLRWYWPDRAAAGKAYKMRLLYTGRTVMRLVDTNESLRRIIDRQATVLITRVQAEEWAGKITDAEWERLAACIPNSSIPDAIGTIVSDAIRDGECWKCGGTGRVEYDETAPGTGPCDECQEA